MILGTVFGGWWGWEYGPWGALLGGVVGGFFGGLLLAIVTTTFGVNHIVAGFAINILAPGVARFMSTILFVDEQGGSLTNSPGVTGDIGEFTMPFLSGGTFFGNETPDALGRIDEWNWFAVSDVAGMLKGLTAGVRYDVLVGVGLFAATRVPAVAHALRAAPALGRRAPQRRRLARRARPPLPLHRGVDLRRPRRARRSDARHLRRPLQPGPDRRQGVPRPGHARRRQLAAGRRRHRRLDLRLLRRDHPAARVPRSSSSPCSSPPPCCCSPARCTPSSPRGRRR